MNQASSVWRHNERGLHLYGSALYDRAIPEFEEAIHLASVTLPALLFNLGAAYLRSRRYEKARAALVDGLALDPDDRLGHWCLGQTLEALGEHFDARTEFQTTVELDPDSPEGRSAEEATRLWTSR